MESGRLYTKKPLQCFRKSAILQVATAIIQMGNRQQ